MGANLADDEERNHTSSTLRQVSEEEGRRFAEEHGLLWLGETSCYDKENNCQALFDLLT